MVVTMNISHVFKYPLEIVAQTHLTKYPTAKEKNVLNVDIVEKKTEKGVEYTRRIATCLNVVPRMMRRLSGLNVDAIHIEEQCWMDKSERTLRLQSKNITFAKHARLHEESIFRPLVENPHWTWFEQTGIIEIHGLGPFGRVLEMFAHCFLQNGVKKSLRIMEELLTERARTRYSIASTI